MIADLAFGPARNGVRALRFVRRPSLPIEAACVVANGVREALREVFAERCELVLGEPATVDAATWSLLARDALLYLTRGRQTDVVLVVPQRDARRLVLRAFGEGDALPDGACSALERHALERIAARCATAFEPLCAERSGAPRAVAAHDVPRCAAYFDVRVTAPIALTLGIGIVRDLPDPGPSGTLRPSLLDDVPLELRAVLGTARLPAAAIVDLRLGDVVRLDTEGATGASLNIGSRRLTSGACGVSRGRHSFIVGEGIAP